jgi:hypothetical protein
MFVIHDDGAELCDGMTRREWLRVGGLGMLSLAPLLHARQAHAASAGSAGVRGRAKSCIIMCFLGGPPQHETWDPKPDAPAEIRGDLKPISSAVPGLFVGELMPRTARLTHKIAVLRAMHTNDNAHSSSGYYMTTGIPHQALFDRGLISFDSSGKLIVSRQLSSSPDTDGSKAPAQAALPEPPPAVKEDAKLKPPSPAAVKKIQVTKANDKAAPSVQPQGDAGKIEVTPSPDLAPAVDSAISDRNPCGLHSSDRTLGGWSSC